MYGVTGDDATGRRQIGRCFPINWNSVVQLCPPARPYIKRSFEGVVNTRTRLMHVSYLNDVGENEPASSCWTCWPELYSCRSNALHVEQYT